jgi:tetratricopeptide (TPR) repeat protein
VHLSDELVRELSGAVRPGKAEILVKTFADAVAAYAAGDLDEAIRLGDQSKHMALRSPNAREFLGLALYAAGRWKEAATELSTFRRIAGSTEQNHVLADCYRALGKPGRAVELCDEIDPARAGEEVYFEGAIVAAGALADLGRLDEAIARLEGLNLDPDVAQAHHIRTWYVLGDLLERKGRFTQARGWFEAVAAADAEMTDAPQRAERLQPS